MFENVKSGGPLNYYHCFAEGYNTEAEKGKTLFRI